MPEVSRELDLLRISTAKNAGFSKLYPRGKMTTFMSAHSRLRPISDQIPIAEVPRPS